MPQIRSDPSITDAVGFEDQVREVLHGLRRAMADVLASVPGLRSAGTATDVQRALQINSKLSWQVQKFATTEDPLEVVAHLPKPAAMKRFCKAARQVGASERAVARLNAKLDEFDGLIERHAGDRATFDAMVGGLRGEATAPQLAQQHRRDAFRAQSHVWGVQAKAMLSLMIFKAGREPGGVDGITVGGQINLRRFRHDARWIVFGRCVASDKRIVGAGEVQPLVPEDFDRYGAPLIARYCEFARSTFRTVQTQTNVRYIEATSEQIGNDSVATYLSGEVWRNVAYTKAVDGTQLLLARARVRAPVEVLYHDVLVHRDLSLAEPELRLYGDLRTGDEALSHEDTERLPCFDSITALGSGADAVFAPEFPRYPELAHDAITAVGWNPKEFKVFRCRMAYPVLPSTAVIRFAVT